jgi:hypothetical protein
LPKAYEKYGWIILLAIILIIAIRFILFIVPAAFGNQLHPNSSAIKNFTGLTWDELLAVNPGLANFYMWLEREISIIYFSFLTLLAITTAFPYRRGKRWAWYTLWILPFFTVAITIHGTLVTGITLNETIQTVGLLLLIFLGLFLPYRMFFSKKP